MALVKPVCWYNSVIRNFLKFYKLKFEQEIPLKVSLGLPGGDRLAPQISTVCLFFFFLTAIAFDKQGQMLIT